MSAQVSPVGAGLDAGEDSVAGVLARRGILVKESFLAGALAQALGPYLTAPHLVGLTDADRALLAGVGADVSPEDHPYEQAAARTAAAYTALVATAIPLAEAATVAGVTRARMQQRVGNGEIWAIRGPGRRWLLPALQFSEGGGLLPGLIDVFPALLSSSGLSSSTALPELHPLDICGFLTTPQPELARRGRDCTPLQWLAAGGDPEPVRRLAAALRELPD